MDTSISGSVGGNAPLFRVTLRAAGVQADRPATLRVTLTRVVLLWNVDPQCDRVATGLLCQVTSADPSVSMNVVALPGASVTATLEGPADDPDPANNTWRAVLD